MPFLFAPIKEKSQSFASLQCDMNSFSADKTLKRPRDQRHVVGVLLHLENSQNHAKTMETPTGTCILLNNQMLFCDSMWV